MSENNIAKRNLDKNEVFLTNLFDQYKGFHIPNSAEPRGKEKTSRKGKATQPNNSESATTKNAKKKTEKKEAGRRGISVFVNQMWCTFIEQTKELNTIAMKISHPTAPFWIVGCTAIPVAHKPTHPPPTSHEPPCELGRTTFRGRENVPSRGLDG